MCVSVCACLSKTSKQTNLLIFSQAVDKNSVRTHTHTHTHRDTHTHTQTHTHTHKHTQSNLKPGLLKRKCRSRMSAWNNSYIFIFKKVVILKISLFSVYVKENCVCVCVCVWGHTWRYMYV